MELTINPTVSYVSFAHEDYMNIFVIWADYCQCGCGYFQIFGTEDNNDNREVRIDILTRDESRHMYE